MDSLRYANVAGFEPVFFRRELTDIKMPGGLWDEAMNLYTSILGTNVKINNSQYKLSVKNGMSVQFKGIAHAKDLIGLQGLQSGGIYFDELTTFSEEMFWFLFSRNRNRADVGIPPYIKSTCNPDPDSFVARLIEWYIGTDGFPIPERAGKVRYMIRNAGEVFMYDDFADCYRANKTFLLQQSKDFGVRPETLVRTFSFVPGKISDNKALLANNPSYLASLLALDENERARYLDGNWKVKIDSKALCNYEKLIELSTNYTETGKRYITCDPSGFGRDLTVMMVWDGWTIIEVHVWKKTDSVDVYNEIEKLRERHKVPTNRVVIDADGVGHSTAKLARYQRFHGGHKSMTDPKSRLREDFRNLKTQCCYRIADRINVNDVAIRLTRDTSSFEGQHGYKMLVQGRVYTYEDLIRADLRAWKKEQSGDGKKAMIDKDKQKEILGRSPDFGDNVMMREFIELLPDSFK